MWCGAMLVLASTLTCDARADPLFDDLGGLQGVARVAHELVRVMVADPRIAPKFDGVDLVKLEKRLTEQLCVVSGGACTYTGKDMRASHAELDVTVAQFNAVVEDLQEAMDHAGMSSTVQNRLLALLAPMERDIVTR